VGDLEELVAWREFIRQNTGVSLVIVF